jgi:hypothetical protein
MIIEFIITALIVAVVSILSYKAMHWILLKIFRRIEDHLGLEIPGEIPEGIMEEAVNEE